MNPYDFFVSVIFASLLVPLAKLIWDLCFPKMTIHDDQNIQIFTRMLMKQQFVNADCQKMLPTEGVHVYWFRRYPVYCVARKKVEHNSGDQTICQYFLTTFPFCFFVFEMMRKELAQPPSDITAIWRPKSNGCFVKTVAKMPRVPNKFQDHVLGKLDELFLTGVFTGVILLCGTPGIGKSKCARLLGQHLRHKYAMNNDVYEGLNLLSRNFDLLQLVARKKRIQILLFDEIDVAFHMTNQKPHNGNNNDDDDNGDKPSRQSKISKVDMCNFLDTLSDLTGVIVIFTTNLSLAAMEEKYGVYIRAGRVDLKIEVI